MKRRLALIAAFSAVLGLSACGGGSDDSSSSAQVYDAPALVRNDTVVGTGAEALASSTVTVNYTLWLYDTTKAQSKGARMDGPATLTRRLGDLIPGWQQGVPGMKVGGKRTLIVPSSLGYGTRGSGAIPPNAGLVFDIELTAVN